MKLLATLALISFCLVGCGQPQHHQHAYTIHHPVQEHTYRHQQTDGSWIYYYILFYPNGNVYYYYSSTTEVTNFASVNFTRSVGSLPKEVSEEVEQAEQVSEQEVPAADQPESVQADTTESQMSDMTSEGGISSTESSTPTDSGSTTDSSSSTSSSDSSSSSSDSGGGSSD